jgi:hypothetical protein
MLINYPSRRSYEKLVCNLKRKPAAYFAIESCKYYLDITDSEFEMLDSSCFKKAKPKGELLKNLSGFAA